MGTAAENVIIVMMDNLLPLTLVAVYIAVILSAIMSTIDSLIIVASSAITRDLYQKVMNPNIDIEQLTKLSKIVTLLLACLALVLAMSVAVLSPGRTIFLVYHIWLVRY